MRAVRTSRAVVSRSFVARDGRRRRARASFISRRRRRRDRGRRLVERASRAMSAGDENDVQIAVSFVTRLPDAYRVSESAIEVPGKLTRYGLSEVVNHLLGADAPTPFDFLIDGVLLRTSLAKLALRLGKSAEATLEVEYVPALGTPKEAESARCAEWISSVDGSWAKAVVTGSFDGKARLWTPKGKLLCELEGHEQRVVAVSLAPPADASAANDSCVVLSASADRHVRSYAVTLRGKKSEIEEQKVFKGHQGTVTDVASAMGAQLFASCSVDRTARVWKLAGGEPVAEKASKKRKLKKRDEDEGSDDEQDGLGEELVLTGHTDQVRAVAWESPNVVWTGSYDHTVRAWDVETGEERESNRTNSSVHCLAIAPDGGKYAYGGNDRLVNVWDPRETTSKACLKLKSHEVRTSSRVTARDIDVLHPLAKSVMKNILIPDTRE